MDRSQAWSEPLLTICSSDRPHIRSHLKGNPVDAPQCLTLPRALVPPRGEKKPSTLRCISPMPRFQCHHLTRNCAAGALQHQMRNRRRAVCTLLSR